MNILKISGADAYKFLQGLVSNDVGELIRQPDEKLDSVLQPNDIDTKAIHAYLLTPQGKYLFDFFIAKKSDAFYLIILPTNNFVELLKKLKIYKLRSDVVIEDLSNEFEVISLKLEEICPHPHPLSQAVEGTCFLSFVDPRAENFCSHIIFQKDKKLQAFNHPSLLSPSDYKELRINRLIPEGDDFEYEKTFPLHYRMIETNSVNFKKGCYVGQEVTARMHHKGTIRKTLFKVQADENLENFSSHEIFDGELVVGKLLSAFENKALAYLSLDAVENNSALKLGNIKLEAFHEKK